MPRIVFAPYLTAAGLIALALLSGCERRRDVGPVVASVIGTSNSAGEPARVIASATTQGLVRFDAVGQIEPGLAERWIVIDGGLRYIFRLRRAVWNDGEPVTAQQVVTILKRRLRAADNPLTPYLSAIDDIVDMTPQVIEVRLDRSRPDLLKLFAQPELSIARARPPGTSGPFAQVAGTRPRAAAPGRRFRPRRR